MSRIHQDFFGVLHDHFSTKEEADAFGAWAFGPEFESMFLRDGAALWNERHGQDLQVKGAENVTTSLRAMIRVYLDKKREMKS